MKLFRVMTASCPSFLSKKSALQPLVAAMVLGVWSVFGAASTAWADGVNEAKKEVVKEVAIEQSAEHPPRFEQLTLEQLNVYQKPLGEQVMKVSSVGIGGPYNPLLRSPVMGQRMFDLLYYLRWNSSMPLRLNEFAILIIGRQWRSQVEWAAHAPLAIKAGLSPDVVADLKAQKRPAKMQPDEAVVYDMIDELTQTHKLSDATYARAKALFTEQQLVDLSVVTGTYITLALMMSMVEQGLPAGRELAFKAGEP